MNSQVVAERIKRLVALANASDQQTVEIPVHIAEQWVAILEAEDPQDGKTISKQDS